MINCRNRIRRLLLRLTMLLYLLTFPLKVFSVTELRENKNPQSQKYGPSPHFEIEPRFLIMPDQGVVFSGNTGRYAGLFRYKAGKVLNLGIDFKNSFSPFLFNKRVTGLIDSLGEQEYSTTNSGLNSLISFRRIRAIFTFDESHFLILQLKNDKKIYLVNCDTKNFTVLASNVNQLYAACYLKEKKLFVLNYDNVLVSAQPATHEVKLSTLDFNNDGGKMNPYLYKHHLYYANNRTSEFYQLYRLDFDEKSPAPLLVLKSNHDLKMPKYDGKSLLFVEIINSEYLLRERGDDNKIKPITTRGVVFDFGFYGKSDIIYSYTDFFLPKCLMIYNRLKPGYRNLTSKPIRLQVRYRFISRTKTTSPAYLIEPPQKRPRKGIVLFIHAGVQQDFSPRWDPIIISLALHGYSILAPNCPMSFGYGKKFSEATIPDILTDLNAWKIRLLKHNQPLYLLTYSSGNFIMEEYLEKNSRGVSAAASFFGIPYKMEPSNQIPCLFILGQLDPRMNFNRRLVNLQNAHMKNKNILIDSYKDEGHMFRRNANLEIATSKMINFLNRFK